MGGPGSGGGKTKLRGRGRGKNPPIGGRWQQLKLEALKLRRIFVSTEGIAERLEVSRSTVQKLLREAHDEINRESLETAADLRARAAAALEEMAVRARARGDDRLLLSVIDRHCRLFGLDADVRVKVEFALTDEMILEHGKDRGLNPAEYLRAFREAEEFNSAPLAPKGAGLLSGAPGDVVIEAEIEESKNKD